MGNTFQQQIKVVPADAIREGVTLLEVAFFDADGEPLGLDGYTTTAIDQDAGDSSNAIANTRFVMENPTTTAIDQDAGDSSDAIANTKFVMDNAGKDKTEISDLELVTAADAEEAAGSIPSASEFQIAVLLANANKAAINDIIAALQA